MTKSFDYEALLDPEISGALKALGPGGPALSAATLADIRAARAAVPAPALSNQVLREDHRIPGRDVSLRVHRNRQADGLRPAIFWMHGGGLVLGTNDIDDPRFDTWCPALDCVGISVDYSLAPEAQYPVPLEDCYAGLSWVFENAAALGVDPTRIGIGGSSAGGGLAAALALMARDRGALHIAFQALIYPMLDDRGITPSSQWPDPVWPPSANAFGWRSYLGELEGDDVPAYAAAARATDLDGLPPAYICVGGLDVFVDEDVDYATRLRQAGVAVDLHVYAGAPHGYDSLMPGTRIARNSKRDLERWLAVQLHPEQDNPC